MGGSSGGLTRTASAGDRQRRVVVERVTGAVIDALVDVGSGSQHGRQIGGRTIARRHKVFQGVGTRPNLSCRRLDEGEGTRRRGCRGNVVDRCGDVICFGSQLTGLDPYLITHRRISSQDAPATTCPANYWSLFQSHLEAAFLTRVDQPDR
jgi:hypothetical protein